MRDHEDERLGVELSAGTHCKQLTTKNFGVGAGSDAGQPGAAWRGEGQGPSRLGIKAVRAVREFEKGRGRGPS